MNAQTNALLSQIVSICNRFKIPYMPMESNVTDCSTLPFTCSYMKIFYFQNTQLGHKDLHFYLDKETDYKLIAVRIVKPTTKMFEMMEKLGQFYGMSYKKIEKDPLEYDHYFIYF
ncbi:MULTISPECIES: hypothetical protein [Parabacteroides]|jgi:hypothetical protein|uniref:Uncharacterized protein n=4 Tax=Parabacteroides TaxID=375288 RepID=A0A0F5IKF5_9BACT|nr:MULTISPECIES: hypothetical protein [Parabacteroides]EOS17879.1 hypothetical protein C803_02085 [Parabacteroides goldsteinii dnLKV18]KAI4360278.1 hypothetical protein C825_002330 [Parabacteroides sp. ASF519]KKB46039.1 hypothetical protein HMPREF1536_05272 [Parabacteroides gordonii MS-1 = DSM 23371]MBC5645579.1 hypothetical protein [Parabacteroides segnis]MBF0762911.1 hypothetical protein [Parabacteroides goldsteinii]